MNIYMKYHFISQGLDIDIVDKKGSTPLHWACYSGMENSSNALIAWGSNINKQEMSYGMCPLHLAVMSGNGHIVKKLLHKGCDREIKASNGKLALEMAREN
jgi:palmitoyltransferase